MNQELKTLQQRIHGNMFTDTYEKSTVHASGDI